MRSSWIKEEKDEKNNKNNITITFCTGAKARSTCRTERFLRKRSTARKSSLRGLFDQSRKESIMENSGTIQFDHHGKILNKKQVLRRRYEKGYCLDCGIVKTHKVGLLLNRRPLTNSKVNNGSCLACLPAKKKHKRRSRADVRRSRRESAATRHLVGNLHDSVDGDTISLSDLEDDDDDATPPSPDRDVVVGGTRRRARRVSFGSPRWPQHESRVPPPPPPPPSSSSSSSSPWSSSSSSSTPPRPEIVDVNDSFEERVMSKVRREAEAAAVAERSSGGGSSPRPRPIDRSRPRRRETLTTSRSNEKTLTMENRTLETARRENDLANGHRSHHDNYHRHHHHHHHHHGSRESNNDEDPLDLSSLEGRDEAEVLALMSRDSASTTELVRACLYLRRRRPDDPERAVDALSETLSRRDDDPLVVEHALAALWATAALSDEHRSLVGERTLRWLLRRRFDLDEENSDDDVERGRAVRAHLCGLCAALAADPRFRAFVVDLEGGLDAVCRCLSVRGDAPSADALRVVACRALVASTGGDDDDHLGDRARRVLRARRAVARLVTVLRERAENPNVVEHAAAALCAVVGDDDDDGTFVRELTRSNDGVDALLAASRRRSDEPSTQTRINVVLCAVARRCRDARVRSSLLAGLSAVLSGMSFNSGHAPTQRFGLVAICSLMNGEDDDDVAREVEACYGLDVLAHVLEENMDDDTVRRLACELLYVCSRTVAPDRLVAAEVPQTIISAMRHERSDAAVRDACLGVLWNASPDEEVPRILVESGGVSSLVRMITEEEDDDDNESSSSSAREPLVDRRRRCCRLLADVAASPSGATLARRAVDDLAEAFWNAATERGGDDAETVTQAFRGLGNLALRCRGRLPSALSARVDADAVGDRLEVLGRDARAARAGLFLVAALARYAPAPVDDDATARVVDRVARIVRENGPDDPEVASRALDALGQIARRSPDPRAVATPSVLHAMSDALWLFPEHPELPVKILRAARTTSTTSAEESSPKYSDLVNAASHLLTNAAVDAETRIEGFRTLRVLLSADRHDSDVDHDKLAEAFSVTVLAHPTNLEVLREAFLFGLAHSCCEDVAWRNVPNVDRVLEIVLNSLDAFRRRDTEQTRSGDDEEAETPSGLVVAVRLLANWTTAPKLKEAVVVCSGYSSVADVVAAVQEQEPRATSTADLLAATCTLISHLAANNVVVAMALFYTEAVDVTLNALAFFPRDRGLVREALSALSSLCVVEDVRAVVVERGGGVERLADAVRVHGSDDAVLATAVRLLHALVADAARYVPATSWPVASAAALAALARRPDSRRVVRRALGTLDVAAERDPVPLAAPRTARLLVETTRRHLFCARVQERGANLTRRAAAFASARAVLSEDGVATVLADGAAAHLEDPRVQIAVCRALTAAAAASPSSRRDVVDQAILAARYHHDDDDVLAAAYRCVSRVAAAESRDERRRRRLITEKELRWLWDPLRARRGVTTAAAWESYCAMVRSLCVAEDDDDDDAAIDETHVDMVRSLPDAHALLFDAEERFTGTCRRSIRRVLDLIAAPS